ncbi:MAG: Ig-like domain-containing protein [Spirochaetota bacterium]
MKRLVEVILIILLSFQFYSCYQSDIWNKTTDKKDDTAPSLISATATNNTQIELVFSEELDQQSAEISGNYTITGITGFTVTGAVRNSADFTRVILTTSSQLNTTYTIAVANVKDKFENLIGTSNTASFTGDALPAIDTVAVNNNTQIQVVFTEPLFGSGYYRIYNSSMLEIYSYNLNFNSAISATFLTPSQSNSAYYISIDGFYDSNGNYAVATDTYPFNGDAKPYLTTYALTSATQMEVYFSEDMEQGSAETSTNYVITGGSTITIIGASQDISNLNHVTLSIASPAPFQVLTSYTLTVTGVMDSTANIIGTPNTIPFSTGSTIP